MSQLRLAMQAPDLAPQRAGAQRNADVTKRFPDGFVRVPGTAQLADLQREERGLAVDASGRAFGLQLHGSLAGGGLTNLGAGRAANGWHSGANHTLARRQFVA